jgi:DNA-binding NarL/FixJ family response regulator
LSDLFICPHKKKLENWSEACPDGKVYASISAVRDRQQKHLFWLHAEKPDSQSWVAAAINEILQKFPDPKIVVLSNVPDQRQAIENLKLGAAGYCHAYMPANVLHEVKAVIEHGGLWLGAELLQRLITVSTSLAGSRPQHITELTEKLTAREKEVALEAAKGLSNKHIARTLDITERTVKAHLKHIFERLQVKDRLQLALLLSERRAEQR